MSPAPKNKVNWQPTTSLTALKARANLLAKIREFFAARQVLEVETPLLSHATIPDPNIHSFATQYFKETLYLQTSPEFAMKRLLAKGSGDIFQICKAFRNEEHGFQHNPEFTILEWYRVGFDHHALMQDMDDFLHFLLNTNPAEKVTYQAVFQKYLSIDPLNCSTSELIAYAKQHGINEIPDLDKDSWLNLLFAEIIEPKLGLNRPTFIYNYPASQAALAKINGDIAERFELFIDGIELANGFHELTDATEQRMRFEEENDKRLKQNLPTAPLDENFLAALKHGMPNCAGVAVGIDRLLLLIARKKNIKHVISFPVTHA